MEITDLENMPVAYNSSTELAEAGESVVRRDSQLNSEFKTCLGAMGSYLILHPKRCYGIYTLIQSVGDRIYDYYISMAHKIC